MLIDAFSWRCERSAVEEGDSGITPGRVVYPSGSNLRLSGQRRPWRRHNQRKERKDERERHKL